MSSYYRNVGGREGGPILRDPGPQLKLIPFQLVFTLELGAFPVTMCMVGRIPSLPVLHILSHWMLTSYVHRRFRWIHVKGWLAQGYSRVSASDDYEENDVVSLISEQESLRCC